MFESLSDKLQAVFSRLRNKGKLTEEDVDLALKEVRLALLEADVNFKVVKGFVAKLRERAIGSEVLESLTPVQQVIKIVNEELIAMLGGGGQSKITVAPSPPTVVMLVGLQGSGKTTTIAKLAMQLRKQGQRPLLVAADTYRPAAINQLITLGKQIDMPVFSDERAKPPQICESAVKHAKNTGLTAVLLDTAGRLHVDDSMMGELQEIQRRTSPTETLLVADAMTGQDAVRVAEEFNSKVKLTGLILTKMDGDARGGAALSMRAVTGVPIKFVGVGEKLDALEPFFPERMASRILGMGDVLSLIEKAQENYDQAQAQKLEKKLKAGQLDLEDFLEQMQQLKNMGPLSQVLDMIPGLNKLARTPEAAKALDGNQMKRVEAIVLSMTPEERRNPQMIGGSRKRRIARGSGTTPADVNRLLNQFFEMQKMMKAMASGKGPFGRGKMPPGLPGGFGL
ncbi:MAG TPA: signal recognition particle protein [Chloroflexota bacterium]|nr:signal recognition particle protein [Chloroflexota bacterium]